MPRSVNALQNVPLFAGHFLVFVDVESIFRKCYNQHILAALPYISAEKSRYVSETENELHEYAGGIRQ